MSKKSRNISKDKRSFIDSGTNPDKGMPLEAFIMMFDIDETEIPALEAKYGDYVPEADIFKESDARGAGVKIEILGAYTSKEEADAFIKQMAKDT